MKKTFFIIALVSTALLIGLNNCSKEDDNTTGSLVAEWLKADTSGNTFHFVVNDHGGYTGGITVGGPYVPAVWGTYTNTASTITITDTAGTSCAGIPGTYNYSIHDNHMVLTANSDACVVGTPRSDILVGTWTK